MTGIDAADSRIAALLAGEAIEDMLRLQLHDGSIRQARLLAKTEYHPETREVFRIVGYCDWVDNGSKSKSTGTASQDKLTGLYNSVGFEELLDSLLNRRLGNIDPFVVMSISLDCYSDISLAFGKSLADRVLIDAARRLANAVGLSGILARLHTDQFILLMQDCGPDECSQVAQSCVAALTSPFSVGEALFHVEPVVGASRFPLDGDSPRLLIRHAGLAQDHARHMFQQFAVFENEMELRVQHNLALLGDLRRALATEGELKLAYQPVRSFEQRRVTHVEALLRWDHPQQGRIPPGDFVPILEQSSLIQPITDWVLQRALEEIAPLWKSSARVGVCINVSPQNLVGRDFVGAVRKALARHDLPPEALGVELTETQLMAQESLGPITETLRALTNAGVKVWLDDFGTGASTLIRLQQLPATGLKIDRSFTQDLAENRRNRDLVRISVDIARLLGLEVIAEGIEEKSDYDAVSVLGCDASQGYFVGHPLPIDKLADFLRAGETPGS